MLFPLGGMAFLPRPLTMFPCQPLHFLSMTAQAQPLSFPVGPSWVIGCHTCVANRADSCSQHTACPDGSAWGGAPLPSWQHGC